MKNKNFNKRKTNNCTWKKPNMRIYKKCSYQPSKQPDNAVWEDLCCEDVTLLAFPFNGESLQNASRDNSAY